MVYLGKKKKHAAIRQVIHQFEENVTIRELEKGKEMV